MPVAAGGRNVGLDEGSPVLFIELSAEDLYLWIFLNLSLGSLMVSINSPCVLSFLSLSLFVKCVPMNFSATLPFLLLLGLRQRITGTLPLSPMGIDFPRRATDTQELANDFQSNHSFLDILAILPGLPYCWLPNDHIPFVNMFVQQLRRCNKEV